MLYGRPIMATSLNLAGEQSLTNLEELKEELKENVDLIVDAGKTQVGIASTIIKVEDNQIKTLREGPIKF